MNGKLRYLFLIVILFFSMGCYAQTPKGVAYKVKKKDTIFSIAKKNGLTVVELMDANPVMKQEGYELKKGDTIFIPVKGKEAHAKAGASTSQKAGSTQSSVIRIGVMLPLHNVDGDGRRMTEYYRGLLLACDSLRRAGISTDIHAWNVDADADISVTLRDPAAAKCQIIFGPLYSTQVRALAEFCKARDIKLVIPFSINGDDVSRYQQIFQIYESPDQLNNDAIDAFLKRFDGYHTVLIDCNDATSKKGIFTFALRNRLTNVGRKYSITNLQNSEEQFQKAFSTTQPNVVVLNTGRAPELAVAVQKLRSLIALHPTTKVALFGYTEWFLYIRQRLDDFFALDTYIPANFYYNSLDPRTQQLEKAYRQWFHKDMLYAFPRFALTGYDHGQYFLRGLHAQGKNFRGLAGQSDYKPLQSPLIFRQVGNKGGMQNMYFHLIHYTHGQSIEALAY